MSAVAGLLLAAGAGRRYGMPKALVERDGVLLVERGAGLLSEGGCDPVLVVLGAAAAEVRSRANLSTVDVVVNGDWAQGMGSSLRAGLTALATAPSTVVAALVLLVDLPGMTAPAVRRVAGHAAPEVLATATYRGQRGHPVLLGRAHWAAAIELAVGDAGARDLLRAHEHELVRVPCDDIADGTDLDRPASG
ncbi:MAG: nucleotidyltransferase family protein [Micromonosporaceae bacterium]|nr:nucleotidyltransferase family protein [Micromonosporaceae bacterium]